MDYPNTQSGFTFIEFVVIVSIFAIMTGVALFNFRGFTSKVRFSNLVQDVALTLQQAQQLGISSGSQSGDVRVGVYFPYSAGYGPSFSLFRDLDNDGVFNDTLDLVVDTVTIGGGDQITDIYVGGLPITDNLSVTFKRPFPEPLTRSASGSVDSGAQFALRLHDPERDSTACVYIEPTGQVRASSVCPS